MRVKYVLSLLLSLSVFSFAANADEIVVGGKTYTEQLLMASMTQQLLESKGYDIDKRDGLGPAVLRKAQENGQVDIYWEYTGTVLTSFYKVKERLSPQQAYDRVSSLDKNKGLIWLNPSEANNTYALAVRKNDALMADINTISDLANLMQNNNDLKFATGIVFPVRPDGLRPLQSEYGFKFKRANVKKMDAGLTYNALKLKEVNIALVYATDGRIEAFDFKLLQDDKNFFPNYAIVPVMREETYNKYPEVVKLLNNLSSKLDDKTMQELNAQVDVEKQTIETVTKKFLKQQNLI